MHPEAVYWALLTGEPPPASAAITVLLEAWHGAGNRSVRDLFAFSPDVLAAAMGRPEEALAPLLALRARLPQAQRLVDRLAREGVDLVTWWERRYPRVLKETLDQAAPTALWFVGPLEALSAAPVAILGTRDADAEAVACARALAGGLAGAGHAVLSGVARAVERATLEGVFAAEGGVAVAVLGQGIARALPDLRKLAPRLREGRLLLLSRLHPEAPWQPWLEEGRSAVAVALAERVVVVQAGLSGGTWEAAQQALRFGRPLFVRESAADGNQALLAEGAPRLPWPVIDPAELVAAVLESSDASREEPIGAASTRKRRERETPSPAAVALTRQSGDGESVRGSQGEPGSRRVRVGAPTGDSAEDVAAQAATAADDAGRAQSQMVAGQAQAQTVVETEGALEEALLHYLQRSRRKVTGKGRLLLEFPVPEGTLDRALAALIGAGRLVERRQRAGAAYAAAKPEEVIGPGSFQPSLFALEE